MCTIYVYYILGPVVLRDGVRERWRPHVPDPAVREVQGASRSVSNLRNYKRSWRILVDTC